MLSESHILGIIICRIVLSVIVLVTATGDCMRKYKIIKKHFIEILIVLIYSNQIDKYLILNSLCLTSRTV